MTEDWAARARELQEPLHRKLFVVGVLTSELEPKGIRPVIVGGTAVEWYTRGLYRSADVDLLCPWEDANAALLRMGFVREGRHWFRADLGVAVEAPASSLETYRDRTTDIEVEGLRVRLVSAEEAVLDRLRACVHWTSALDGEQAFQMMVVHEDRLDWGYLEQRAVRDQVVEKLQELRKRLVEVPE